jgi:hypothetical protein
MKNTEVESGKNEKSNVSQLISNIAASDLLNEIKFQRNKDDLLPQASSLARFLLSDILQFGRVSYLEWRKRARNFLVNIDSVLLRLPDVQITDDYIELKKECVINPSSPDLIQVPSHVRDALLNVRNRSKFLYLTFSSVPASHTNIFVPNSDLVQYFTALFTDATQCVEVRLVAISQTLLFSEDTEIEKLRHDAIAILREYHRDVNPISEYFQSFTRKPTLAGMGEFIGGIIRPLK